jgi:hypothetical protein
MVSLSNLAFSSGAYVAGSPGPYTMGVILAYLGVPTTTTLGALTSMVAAYVPPALSSLAAQSGSTASAAFAVPAPAQTASPVGVLRWSVQPASLAPYLVQSCPHKSVRQR